MHLHQTPTKTTTPIGRNINTLNQPTQKERGRQQGTVKYVQGPAASVREATKIVLQDKKLQSSHQTTKTSRILHVCVYLIFHLSVSNQTLCSTMAK